MSGHAASLNHSISPDDSSNNCLAFMYFSSFWHILKGKRWYFEIKCGSKSISYIWLWSSQNFPYSRNMLQSNLKQIFHFIKCLKYLWSNYGSRDRIGLFYILTFLEIYHFGAHLRGFCKTEIRLVFFDLLRWLIFVINSQIDFILLRSIEIPPNIHVWRNNCRPIY